MWSAPRASAHKHDGQALIEHLNEFQITKDNYFDAIVPANCADCDGYHTVVQYKDEYLCVACLSVADHRRNVIAGHR
jgi:hypothetical protein